MLARADANPSFCDMDTAKFASIDPKSSASRKEFEKYFSTTTRRPNSKFDLNGTLRTAKSPTNDSLN